MRIEIKGIVLYVENQHKQIIKKEAYKNISLLDIGILHIKKICFSFRFTLLGIKFELIFLKQYDNRNF